MMALIFQVPNRDGQVPTSSGNQVAIAENGLRAVYLKDCPGEPWKFVFVPVRGPGSGPGEAPPEPEDLAQEAAADTPLPVPTVGMAPASPIPQLVGLTSFLWIGAAEWAPQSASASAGGVTSTVTATPRRVLWDMGNGDSVSCDGPGAPYEPALSDEQQPSNCRYTYERSSARTPGETFTVTTTIEWDVEWVAVGAPGGGPLGTARRSSTTAVQVGEIQALNVPVR